LVLAVLPAAAVAGEGSMQKNDERSPEDADGQHDFDWEIGNWNTHLRRRLRPLSGSDEWATYEGTTTVRPVWGGRANLVELDVRGAAGRIEGLSLRLYDPERKQWSLNFAGSSSGALSPPSVGRFTDGRGEFLSHEEFGGRPILVRFVIEPAGADAWRFEQAFSADDGRTWEVNWIAIDTRASGRVR
jgi:hypothetical protein